MRSNWQPIESALREMDNASYLTDLFCELLLSLRCLRSDLARDDRSEVDDLSRRDFAQKMLVGRQTEELALLSPIRGYWMTQRFEIHRKRHLAAENGLNKVRSQKAQAQDTQDVIAGKSNLLY